MNVLKNIILSFLIPLVYQKLSTLFSNLLCYVKKAVSKNFFAKQTIWNGSLSSPSNLYCIHVISLVAFTKWFLFQGDGTSFIFEKSENVFTFDMHCGKNFPFRKQKSDYDIPLDVNLEDVDYLKILEVRLCSNSF